MVKCLVTKLKGSASNNELLKLGEIRFSFTAIDSPTKNNLSVNIKFKKDSKMFVDGNGYFTDSNLSANNGQEVQFEAGISKTIYVANKNCNISILGKYDIQTLSCTGKIAIPLEGLSFSPELSSLITYDSLCYGDISFVKNLTKLDYLDCHNNRKIYGDISAFAGHKTETVINFYDTNLSGNIESLNEMPNLREIHLHGTQVGGNIDNLAGLPELKVFRVYNTHVLEGNIASMAKFTKLETLDIGNNKVTGYVKTLCENMYQNGRISGSLRIGCGENTVRFDSTTDFPSSGIVTATFTRSGVTYEGLS